MGDDAKRIKKNKIKRLKFLLAADSTPQLQSILREKCRRDIHFFVDFFCWTHDTRQGGRIPFISYKYQRQGIDKILACIEGKEDVGIDKSRDMGVSWLLVIIFVWYWLFKPGALFLIGSRKEEYVDRPGDMKTLFVKIRFIINHLPPWLLPQGFDPRRHATFMKLYNPENGNSIVGESCNADFSRGGRFKAILLDEFAFCSDSDLIWKAAADATPCRIPVSTPNGKSNRFGKLMTSTKDGEKIQNKLSFHWTQHPLKTLGWYEKEKKRRTPSEIAQELDINYDLSVEGVVVKEFNYLSHVVKEPYKFNPDWRTIVSFDFGMTCGSLIAQRDEYDTLHVFKEIVLMNNANTEDLGQATRAYLTQFERRGQSLYTCDPAGNTAGYTKRSESTHIEVLAKHGFSPMLYAKAQSMQSRLKDGIQLLQTLFSTRYQGRERILIYEEGCPTLIEALQSEYRWRVDKKGDPVEVIEEKHPYEDVVDMLRYIAIECFTVQDGRQKKKGIISVDVAFES